LGGTLARQVCAAMFGVAVAVTVARSQSDKPAEVVKTPQTEKPVVAPVNENGGVVRTAMKNVDYHLSDHIIVHIGELSGKLLTKPGEIPTFDDKNSFGMEVDSATIRISMTALTNDLNEFVFAKADAPLKKLDASVKSDKKGNELVIKGLLVSKGGVPFETSGTLSLTPEGWIRVSTHSVKVLKLPVHGLMEMVGLETANLVNTNKVEGVKIDKDDLLLDPEKLLPPPTIRGRLSSIQIDSGEIALAFGGKQPADKVLASTCGGKNYILFRGGTIKFGRLTMTNSLLELLDADPQDSYDFALEHYTEQLVAGYSKSTKAGGLCVHTPDLNKLKSSNASGGKK
jgi:hypothetical protein